jgi:hypothetical protein
MQTNSSALTGPDSASRARIPAMPHIELFRYEYFSIKAHLLGKEKRYEPLYVEKLPLPGPYKSAI